jgi:CRISPR/Cas system-associated protein endoribonuclease Cas2
MSLKIPNDFISGFEELVNLSIDEVKQIAAIISTIPAGTGSKKFESSLASSFTDLDLSQISPMIFSFGNILLNMNDSKEAIAEMLCKALPKNSNIDKEKIKERQLEEKLKIIFESVDNLKSTYKALDLISENHIIYKKGRIFSDIRLLFDDEVEVSCKDRQAVIIHSLKLESIKDEEDRNYYFSLDSADLVKMKELIERALLKEEKIKSDYPNIKFIEITD